MQRIFLINLLIDFYANPTKLIFLEIYKMPFFFKRRYVLNDNGFLLLSKLSEFQNAQFCTVLYENNCILNSFPTMASTSDFSSTFVPRQLLPRTFGKETVYVYPELENDMCNAKKLYGFLTSKAAVEAANIKFDTKLQFLAGVTRTGPLVEVVSNRFKTHAQNLIRCVNNFEVLSYHNRAGQIMVNALDVAGILKLLTVKSLQTDAPRPLCM
jgi:hypothetical protein